MKVAFWRRRVASLGMVCMVAACGTLTVMPGQSTLLPSIAAKTIAKRCSRPGPPPFEGTWTPDSNTITVMEREFGAVRRLRSGCCVLGSRISDLSDSYLQYVGIVANGRKLIYVNAFTGKDPPGLWRTHPVMICDGGTGAWGVVYDPGTREFFDLAVNGIS